MELPFGINPYENDPGAWGASLLNNAELVLGALDAAEVRSVAEIGAYAGDLTRLLLLWGEPHAAKVVAIDPSPQPELEQLEREHSELELIRQPSLTALEHLERTDAVILDGDHNYFTVTQELRRIWAWVGQGAAPPLLLFHDVAWPHARRDDYYLPDQIPAEYRQPLAPASGLYPGIEGTLYGGLPYQWPGALEGGQRNGVLTAIEDFVGEHSELRLAVIPAFFGLGVAWSESAPYAEALETLVAGWDRNPLLERLERNRVLHLASSLVQQRRAQDAEEQLQAQRQLLQRMLDSRAFWAAEMFLRLRQRGRPIFSRREIRQLMKQN